MTDRADPFHEASASDALRAPRVPEFDLSDAPPESGAVSSRALRGPFDKEAAGMGTCLLIVVDGILFTGLFALYATLYAGHAEIFRHGRYFLNPIVGAVGNSVLLLSCLTAALSVRFAKVGNKVDLAASLAATILLAGFFVGIQGAEYADKAQRGLLPGRAYMATEQVCETQTFRSEHERSTRYAERFRLGDPTRDEDRGASRAAVEPLVRAGVLGASAVFPTLPSEPRNAHLFFGVYYLFSGLLALHVLGGAVAWIWLLARLRRGSRSVDASTVGHTALFWNFLAVVRVLMFPLFYLVH